MGIKEEQRGSNWILPSSGLISATFVVFILFANIASATTLSVSEPTLQPHIFTGRSLLQALQECPESFENKNYTIITSRCKGPKYPPDQCCAAFKDFACPYADLLNDEKNKCANTMFSYINLYGKYPPGLFANECRDSKRGLECTEAQSNPPQPNSAAQSYRIPYFILSALTFLPILWHLNLL